MKEPLFSIETDPKCWLYDPIVGGYRVNEDCALKPDQEELESPSFRIIGGHLANMNEYPWQVTEVDNTILLLSISILIMTGGLNLSKEIFLRRRFN